MNHRNAEVPRSIITGNAGIPWTPLKPALIASPEAAMRRLMGVICSSRVTGNPHLTPCCSDRSRHAAAGRWIRQVARLDCTGGRISPYRWQDNRHRECASGSITLQPAPARFSIEVAQTPFQVHYKVTRRPHYGLFPSCRWTSSLMIPPYSSMLVHAMNLGDNLVHIAHESQGLAPTILGTPCFAYS